MCSNTDKTVTLLHGGQIGRQADKKTDGVKEIGRTERMRETKKRIFFHRDTEKNWNKNADRLTEREKERK